MTRVAYRLVAKSAFHLGERGVGLEETATTIHADTLFSALCLMLREMGEDLNSLISLFPRARWKNRQLTFQPGKAPFVLSTAYPFSGSVYLFPRPMISFKDLSAEIFESSKQLKKIQFVSKQIFEALLGGESLKPFLEPGAQANMLLYQHGQVWVSAQEQTALSGYWDPLLKATKFWAVGTQPRVTVDRASSQSELFAAGQLRFAQNCGFYFLVDYFDLSWKPRIEKALYLLGDVGIGGERSVGHGQYDLEIDDSFVLRQPDEKQANAFVALSPFWPEENETKAGILSDAHYALINRRGWVASPDAMGLRRQNVRMLSEGSVFRKCPSGALIDVNPLGFDGNPMVTAHDIWRYGLGFTARCSLEG